MSRKSILTSSASACPPPKTMVFSLNLARFFQLAGGGYFRWEVPKTLPPTLEHPKPSKTNENSIFSAQNFSKTSCNLPRALWKRHRASWSRPKGPWRTLRRPGARARGVRPASKLVPGDFWQPKTIENERKINICRAEPFQNLLQPFQSTLEAPQSLLEPPKCTLEDPLAPRRPRARSPAGLKTGPRRFLATRNQ